MKEYGYSDEDIAALTNSGVLLTNIPPRPPQQAEVPDPVEAEDTMKKAS